MKRRGFTLVELLMVILLIALLLMLLIPGIVEALRKAKRAQCQDNLHTIGTSVHNYCADHNGVWPQRTGNAGGPVATPYEWDDAWFNLLFGSYIVNPKLLYCPDNNMDMAPPGEKWDSTWNRRISYAILDGQPAPTSGDQDFSGSYLGTSSSPASWSLTSADNITDVDSTGWDQGFLGSRVVYDSSGNRVTYTDPTNQQMADWYAIFRPAWSGYAESQNIAIMGDLVLEQPGSWIVNHGTVSNNNPLGMNILYADGHASWASSDVPATTTLNNTTSPVSYYGSLQAARDTQRLWRRIWRQSGTGAGGTYIRWLVKPSDVRLPDKHQ